MATAWSTSGVGGPLGRGEYSMDATALVHTLTWQLAVVCALAFALGALGGVIHDRTAPAAPPADGSAPPALRVPAWRRALVGGVAAVAILYLTHPDGGVALAGGSIAAGYAGQAVLAALESRVVASLAQAQVAERTSDLKDTLAAHAVIAEPPRGEPSPQDEAKLLAAAATITRLRAKYAAKG